MPMGKLTNTLALHAILIYMTWLFERCLLGNLRVYTTCNLVVALEVPSDFNIPANRMGE